MSSHDLLTLITTPTLVSLHAASRDTEAKILSILSAPQSSAVESTKQQAALLSELSALRSLHRQTTQAVRSTKSETAVARSDVDSLHLTLQNLLYEQSHLRTEIEACESYSHPYTSLPLEPIETFLSSHPDLADADSHTLTLARIEAERLQREDLEKTRAALVKKKQALVKENLKRKEDLQGLDGRMEAFIDAARPIQKVLGLGGDEGQKEKEKEKDKGAEDVAMG